MDYGETKASYEVLKSNLSEMAVHAATHLLTGERSTTISLRESKATS